MIYDHQSRLCEASNLFSLCNVILFNLPGDFIFHFINYMSEYMTITDLVQIFVGKSKPG